MHGIRLVVGWFAVVGGVLGHLLLLGVLLGGHWQVADERKGPAWLGGVVVVAWFGARWLWCCCWLVGVGVA